MFCERTYKVCSILLLEYQYKFSKNYKKNSDITFRISYSDVFDLKKIHKFNQFNHKTNFLSVCH